jgi:tRNA pseudouridine38-40 synthase
LNSLDHEDEICCKEKIKAVTMKANEIEIVRFTSINRFSIRSSLRSPIFVIHQNDGRLRYFFEVSYKGTNYHGWQVQSNALSIQQVLQDKLGVLLKRPIEITGSGRTDTGVHAIQQFFHADINEEMERADFMYHLNAVLPSDIVVKSMAMAHKEAHARFDAVSRAYTYEIIERKNPFKIKQAYVYTHTIDLDKLNAAAKELQGRHNFESFSRVKTQLKNFECEIYKAYWHRIGEATFFEVEANRFLRGMVRALVGTLLLVNERKLGISDLKHIIASRNRSKAGRSVPPHGLYLREVKYPNQIFVE